MENEELDLEEEQKKEEEKREEDNIYLSGLAVGFEIYFNVVIRNTQAINPETGNLPNIGAIYADKLNELNNDFAKRGLSFRESAIGRLIRLHFTIIIFRAMYSLQRYNSAMMRARLAQSEEQKQQALDRAKAYLNQYKELCEYMMSYSLSRNLDNTIENAEEMYQSEGYSEEEIRSEKEAVQEEREKLGDLNEKKEPNDKVEENQETKKEQKDAVQDDKPAVAGGDSNPQIRPEDTKDELIPGTDIRKPRDRGVYETDEEYVAFLSDYYGKVFPSKPKENMDASQVKNVNPISDQKANDLVALNTNDNVKKESSELSSMMSDYKTSVTSVAKKTDVQQMNQVMHPRVLSIQRTPVAPQN